MTVLEIALKSIALALADEAKAYEVEIPEIPASEDAETALGFLKEIARRISEVAGSSVAEGCLEAIDKFLKGEISEDDLKIRCPVATELPASIYDPFRRFFARGGTRDIKTSMYVRVWRSSGSSGA